MKICGIDIKGNDAILTVIEAEDNTLRFIESSTKKIPLDDEYSSELLKSFRSAFDAFLNDNSVEKIILLKRPTRGMFVGNSLSFKIECLVQLNEVCPVCFIPVATINAFIKKHLPIEYPKGLNKYQYRSFDAVFTFINKK
jgi:hypothetical protein